MQGALEGRRVSHHPARSGCKVFPVVRSNIGVLVPEPGLTLSGGGGGVYLEQGISAARPRARFKHLTCRSCRSPLSYTVFLCSSPVLPDFQQAAPCWWSASVPRCRAGQGKHQGLGEYPQGIPWCARPVPSALLDGDAQGAVPRARGSAAGIRLTAKNKPVVVYLSWKRSSRFSSAGP